MLHYLRAFFIALCLEAALTGATSGVVSIVGTYNCATYRGAHVVDRFQSVNVPWGTWLKVTTTSEGNDGPSDVGQVFVGFDRGAKRWSIVGVDSSGEYWTRHSTTKNFDDSRWVDVDPDDGGRAIVRVLKSGAQYTFDFTSPGNRGGSDVTHTVCTRK